MNTDMQPPERAPESRAEGATEDLVGGAGGLSGVDAHHERNGTVRVTGDWLERLEAALAAISDAAGADGSADKNGGVPETERAAAQGSGSAQGDDSLAAASLLPEDLLRDLSALHPSESARVYESLDAVARRTLLAVAGEHFTATALAWLDDSLVREAAEYLGPARVAEALRDLDSDDAFSVFTELDESFSNDLLVRLPPKTRSHIQRGLHFPEDSAGRLMQTEVPVVPATWTVGRTIDWMRSFRKELQTDFYELIVVDPHYKPSGRIPISRILQNHRDTPLAGLTEHRLHTIAATTDQEDVAWTFKQYALVSAPVTDGSGRFLGVITADDILEVIEEELEKDLLQLGGVSDVGLFGDVLATVRARLPWLLLSFTTVLLAASVVDIFSATIERYVALAVLLPIVAAVGGNSGTQSLTVAVRGLAQRLLARPQRWRFLRRELTVSVLNGVVLACIAGSLTALWFQEPLLGVIIAAAMIFNLFVAGLAGAFVPFGLQKLGVDPALASGVFVTTATDVSGFLALLGLASLLLP